MRREITIDRGRVIVAESDKVPDTEHKIVRLTLPFGQYTFDPKYAEQLGQALLDVAADAKGA